MSDETRADALKRFEDATDVPMLVLALMMLPLIFVPVVTTLPESADAVVLALDWFIWGGFALHFGVRLVLTTEPRWHFVRRNWADVVIIVVPFLRPLRVLGSARLLRLLGLARVAGFVSVIVGEGRKLLTRHHLHYVILITMLVVLGTAALVAYLERDASGSIDSFPTALWWAVSIVTTVGSGDTTPVTPEGRGVAAALMFVGVGLIGALAANVAAFLVEKPGEADREKLDRILELLEAPANTTAGAENDRLDQILLRLTRLEAELAADDPT